MATTHQEQLYNEIIEYYVYADRLISSIENESNHLAQEQLPIIEEIVGKLEDCTDKLALYYIQFVKEGTSDQVNNLVRNSLNEISAKIEECRIKTLRLYHS